MCSMHGFSDLLFIHWRLTAGSVLESIMWVCLKIVYPEIQWLIIIFPLNRHSGGIPHVQTNPWPLFPLIDGNKAEAVHKKTGTKLKQFIKRREQSWSSSLKNWKNRRANQQSFTKKLRSTTRNLIWEAHRQVTQCNYIALPFLFKKFCTVCDKGL